MSHSFICLYCLYILCRV